MTVVEKERKRERVTERDCDLTCSTQTYLSWHGGAGKEGWRERRERGDGGREREERMEEKREGKRVVVREKIEGRKG